MGPATASRLLPEGHPSVACRTDGEKCNFSLVFLYRMHGRSLSIYEELPAAPNGAVRAQHCGPPDSCAPAWARGPPPGGPGGATASRAKGMTHKESECAL